MSVRWQVLVYVCLALVGAGIALAPDALRFALLAGMIAALVCPLIYLKQVAGLDPFNPLVVCNIALGVMFVARPLVDLAAGIPPHLGYPVALAFNAALGLALLGVVALQFGYLSGLGQRGAQRLGRPPHDLHTDTALVATIAVLTVGLLLYGIFLAQSGGFSTLKSFLSGRSQEHNGIFLASSGYLYQGLLVSAPATLLIIAVWGKVRRVALLGLACVAAAPLVIVAGATGTRSSLLPLLLAPAVFWYLARDKRPRLVPSLAVAYLVLTLGVGFLGSARVSGSDANRDRVAAAVWSVTHPAEVAQTVVAGGDAEMFDSLANELAVVPSRLPFQYGSLLRDVFVRAIPRSVMPGKPLEANDRLVVFLWPEHYAASRASAAFSFIGALYLDSGIVGVVIGMFLVGALLRMLWAFYEQWSDTMGARLLFAMALPYSVLLLRGTLQDTLSRMLFTVVPLVLIMALSHVRDVRGRPGSRSDGGRVDNVGERGRHAGNA